MTFPRQPVREAFIKLAENGLIQIRPQRGSYVNKISLSQVRNGCFVRQAIECAVVRRAAGMVNDEQLYQLEQNLNQQRTAVERQQLTVFSSWMTNFTKSSRKSPTPRLAWDTVENIKATIDRVRYMSLDHVTPPDMMLRQHYDIFQPLVARNPDAVEKAMRLHLQEISESVLLVRQENSDWFSEE